VPVDLRSAPSNGSVALTSPDAEGPAPSPGHPIGADALAGAIREAAVRATLAAGLGAIAVIHAVDSVGKWTETRYMFWMYIALIVGCIATSAAVLFHRSYAVLLAATGLAATVLAGFVIDRTVGMPGATGDIGNWTEPLGLTSLVVEAFVVAIGLGGLLVARGHVRGSSAV
jgi:hypothetical protein